MPDYLFRGSLAKLDPDVYELTQLEAERQYRKLILIASESTAPGDNNKKFSGIGKPQNL